MTDLETTRLCAEAMEISGDCFPVSTRYVDADSGTVNNLFYHAPYDPLHDDAQAMALVKKLGLWIARKDDGSRAIWYVTSDRVLGNYISAIHVSDLNRAICECVAKM